MQRNLFDGALKPRGVLPSGHDHLSTAVVHVEVVHEQAECLHVSQTRQTTHAAIVTIHRVHYKYAL